MSRKNKKIIKKIIKKVIEELKFMIIVGFLSAGVPMLMFVHWLYFGY